MTTSIVDFQVIRPQYSAEQATILEWISRAHTHAEATCQMWELEGEKSQQFYNAIKEKVEKIGLGPNKIQRRGMQSFDFLHTNWKEMEIFRLEEQVRGAGIKKRKQFFDQEAFKIFEQFYKENVSMAPHLIHVTCTGYAAPSSAQRIVSKRARGHATTVTHAYHMGCYAAFPAIRMGSGFLHSGENQVDIVHTEMCSLHFNPTLHTTEQLVVQTLFADGFIKYSLIPSAHAQEKGVSHLKVLALHEEIIPETSESMSWLFEEWGMKMSIAKEVPVLIKRNLKRFIGALGEKAGVEAEELIENALYAIHPGGPKIVQQIQEILSLKQEQIQYSQEILENYGNMSSATLPHVWEKILKDPNIPKETNIVALAFGPGLTISGAVLRKEES